MTTGDPNATQMIAPDPLKTAMGMPTPGVGTTQAISPVQCPICKQHNPPGEIYCVECGLLFTAEMAEEPSVVAAPLPCLTDSAGHEHHLRPGSNVIGRDGTDVLISDSRVSRRHAELVLGENGATIEDLGSTNGTSVGNTRLNPGDKAAVAHGMKLLFGGFEMTLSLPGEAMRTAAMTAPAAKVETGPAFARLEGADGTVFTVLEGETTVGRRPTNAIVLADPFISGAHAKFVVQDGKLLLTDMGSTNGTSKNGDKLTPNEEAEVNDGDEVAFGERKFVVVFGEPPA